MVQLLAGVAHLHARGEHGILLQWLVQHGADLSAQDGDGPLATLSFFCLDAAATPAASGSAASVAPTRGGRPKPVLEKTQPPQR